MRWLPLIDGCSLDESGHEGQLARLTELRPSVVGVERAPAELRVRFDPRVDEGVLRDLVAVERGCCSFLELDYDRSARTLRIASADRGDALGHFAELFTTQGTT